MSAQSRQTDPADDPGLGKAFFQDLRRARLQRTYVQEIKDLYYFYLDERARARLHGMGRFRRAFMRLGLLFKSRKKA